MLDRTQAPPYTTIQSINLPPLQSETNNSGSQVYYLLNPNLKVYKCTLVFSAGSIYSDNIVSTILCANLFSTATAKLSSSEITKKFELYGANVYATQGYKYFTLEITGLSQYFNEALSFFEEIISENIFTQDQLDIAVNRNIQNIKISKEKTEYLVATTFQKNIFSDTDIWGKVLEEEDFKNINLFELSTFWLQNINNKKFTAYLSGNLSKENLNHFNALFSKNTVDSTKKLTPIVNFSKPFNTKISKTNAVQAAIKIGKQGFAPTDEPYFKFLVFNAVFGGYFGSRLMQNIREEKGLTYGISSSQGPVGESYLWTINSSLKIENVDLAISEIQKELKKLCTEKVSEEELETVKNYIAGSILAGTNTVFDLIDKHRFVLQQDLNPDYYLEYIPKIRAVKPDDIIAMAIYASENLSYTVIN